MACNIDGSGCTVCPGMWIAGLLFLVMMIQNVFFRLPTPSKIPATDSAGQTIETKETLNSPESSSGAKP